MIFFVIILFILVIFFPSPVFCIIFNFPSIIKNAAVDIFYRYVRKEKNLVKTGEIVAYTGLFGKGKTLSVVHRVINTYNKYNGKKVWCRRRKKFVIQRVNVISNVSLSIPYEQFVSMEQIVNATDNIRKYDDENDTLTVTLVLGDEFSVQMNSRAFKSNIDPLLLNTILTCRHWNISLYYTAQRFGHVDALLRQVTSYVVDCDKLWRFQRLRYYDAWDLENATNVRNVQSFKLQWWFIRNKDFNAYDTYACVGNLKKSCSSGDMMTEEEILKLRMNTESSNMDGVDYSKKFLKRQKRLNRKLF